MPERNAMNPSLASLILLALQMSVFAIVFALSLEAGPEELTSRLRHPLAYARVVVVMFIVMPLVAAVLARSFTLTPAIKTAMIALAFSPVPPLLPRRQLKAGGEASSVIGLLIAASLASIVIAPIGMPVVVGWFGVETSVSVRSVARVAALTVVGPVAAGQLVRRLSADLARRMAGRVGKAAVALLAVGLVPVLFAAAPAAVSLVGNGVLTAFTAFVAVGLLVGHYLGGMYGKERAVLALATASRHPGIALTIASAAVPEARLLLPAILLYLIVSGVVSGLYLAVRRRRRLREAPPIQPVS